MAISRARAKAGTNSCKTRCNSIKWQSNHLLISGDYGNIDGCRRIGHDLSQTCAKMEKLAELAKSTSLFNDRMGEVDALSRMIEKALAPSINPRLV